MQKKIALITGANRGIGFEIARQLGRKGFHIWLATRNKSRGEAAAERLRAEDVAVTFVQMDVGNEESIKRAFHKVESQTGRLDLLVNNAGILLDEGQNILSLDSADIVNTIQVNTLGVLFVTRIFAPMLQRGSRVINISSGAGSVCGGMGSYAPVYSISKAAENAVTMQLAHALESKGVLVNAVCPGWVRTDMGGRGAPRSVEKGAETPVWMATAEGFMETGKFFRDKRVTSW